MYLSFNDQTKNHKDINEMNRESTRGYMLAQPSDPLSPVNSLKKYLQKCPPDAKSNYLHPLTQNPEYRSIWYCHELIGVNYLGNMMSRISDHVGLSVHYTSHSICSTAVHLLSNAGLQSREMMSVTVHRYWKQPPNYWSASLENHMAPPSTASRSEAPPSTLAPSASAVAGCSVNPPSDAGNQFAFNSKMPFHLENFKINGNYQFNVFGK